MTNSLYNGTSWNIPGNFLYVLDKIFIVNLKKKNLIFGDTLFMKFKVKVNVTR